MTSPSLSMTSTLHGGIGISKFCALIVAKVMISSPVSSGFDAGRMGGDLRLEQFSGAGDALNVIGVGVRGDQHLAGGQVEIHLANQLDDLVDGVEIADVDQQEFAAAIDEIDIDAQPAAGLVVHLDDVRKEILPWQHEGDPER